MAGAGLDELYVADLQLRGQAYYTIRAKRIIVRSWLAWCARRGTDPRAAGRQDFLAYLSECRERGLKASTLRKSLRP